MFYTELCTFFMGSFGGCEGSGCFSLQTCAGWSTAYLHTACIQFLNSIVQSSCMKTVSVGLQCVFRENDKGKSDVNCGSGKCALRSLQLETTPGQNGHNVEMSCS